MSEPKREDFKPGASGEAKFNIAWAKWDRTTGNLAIRKQDKNIKNIKGDIAKYENSIKGLEARLKKGGLKLTDRNQLNSYLKAAKYNLSESQKKLNKIQPIETDESSTNESSDTTDGSGTPNTDTLRVEPQPGAGNEGTGDDTNYPIYKSPVQIQNPKGLGYITVEGDPNSEHYNADNALALNPMGENEANMFNAIMTDKQRQTIPGNRGDQSSSSTPAADSLAIPKPWARGWAGGTGESRSSVNDRTATALQNQGWDLSGVRKSDLPNLYADFRTGRATVFNKGDKSYLHYKGKVYNKTNRNSLKP